MSAVPLNIAAQVRGLEPADRSASTTVRGQVEVATTRGEVVEVTLEPSDPPACPETLDALDSADWVVLGPGSWFTSVIPHLLVPELSTALHDTRARRMVVLNLAPQAGETEGYSPERHLEMLARHAPGLRVDVVLADEKRVETPSELRKAAAALGADLVIDDVASADGTARHDPLRLAAAYEEIFSDPPRRVTG